MKSINRICWAVLWLALIPWAGACAQSPPAPAAPPPATQPLDPSFVKGPWLLHLPGIDGYMWTDRQLLEGLRGGGIGGQFKVYDWTGSERGLSALHARQHNFEQAAKVAQLIENRRRLDPDDRIVITAHSGGCAIAVWALEKLPADLTVDRVVLLAPALSPQYDLTAALNHVRGKCYVFSSPEDVATLKTGTRLFGTMDGVNCDAAGLNGFVMPKQADAQEYKKLVPMPYQSSWRQYGNDGNHFGSMSKEFATSVLAPLVLPPPTTQP